MFLQIDTNDDDFLAAEEWNNWDPGSMGVSYEPVEIGKIYAVMARLFGGLDKDHDARVDRDEMRDGLFGDFDQADAHHDGFLTGDEFTTAFLLPELVSRDIIEMFGKGSATAAGVKAAPTN